MARTNSKTQLEALRQQQLELVRKMKEAEAKVKKEEQKNDQRRKLLAGAIALRELQVNPSSELARALLALLAEGLTRAADRELFGFPALPKPAKDGSVFIHSETGI